MDVDEGDIETGEEVTERHSLPRSDAPIPAEPERPQATNAAANFALKAELISQLRRLKLVDENADPADSVRDILNPALSKADQAVWQIVVNSTMLVVGT